MEKYLVLKSFPHYLISDYGNIMKTTNGCYEIVSPIRNKLGYLIVKLTNKKGEEKTIPVHVLVAQNFLEQSNKTKINFIDKNVQNIKASNLEWI